MFVYMCRIFTSKSFNEISEFMGTGHDHSTLVFSVRKDNELMGFDREIEREVTDLKERIKEGRPLPAIVVRDVDLLSMCARQFGC